jgi:hypothetical protein
MALRAWIIEVFFVEAALRAASTEKTCPNASA